MSALRRWLRERRELRDIPAINDRIIEGLAREGRNMIHREARAIERRILGDRE